MQSVASVSVPHPENGGVGVVFDSAHRTRLQEAFNSADQDDDAALNHEELRELWGTIFPAMSVAELTHITDQVMKDLDTNREGTVTIAELRSYIFDEKAKSEVDLLLEQPVVLGGPVTPREHFWAVVEIDAPLYSEGPRWLKPSQTFWTALSQLAIVLSICTMIAESCPEMQNKDDAPGNAATFTIEATCIGFFTVEFFLRYWSCPDRSEFWRTFFTWVDLLAVLPFYVGLAFAGNPTGALVVLRVLRLLRLLRILKLGRQFEAVQLMLIALARCAQPLAVLMVGVNIITVTLAGSLMFTLELDQAQFDFNKRLWVRDNASRYNDAGKKVDYQSILDAVYWALVTITTVGYGDMYPSTHGGRIVASLTMVVGLTLLAFPLTLIASAFQDVQNELRDKQQIYKRRKEFHHHFAKGGAMALQLPMILLEVEDFMEGMRVYHKDRQDGKVVKVDDASVTIWYGPPDESPSCWHRTFSYSAQSLLTGKLRARYGVCDFEVGMPVQHCKRGPGVVSVLDDRVHIEFDNGEIHRYQKTSIAKGKIIPLRERLDPLPQVPERVLKNAGEWLASASLGATQSDTRPPPSSLLTTTVRGAPPAAPAGDSGVDVNGVAVVASFSDDGTHPRRVASFSDDDGTHPQSAQSAGQSPRARRGRTGVAKDPDLVSPEGAPLRPPAAPSPAHSREPTVHTDGGASSPRPASAPPRSPSSTVNALAGQFRAHNLGNMLAAGVGGVMAGNVAGRRSPRPRDAASPPRRRDTPLPSDAGDLTPRSSAIRALERKADETQDVLLATQVRVEEVAGAVGRIELLLARHFGSGGAAPAAAAAAAPAASAAAARRAPSSGRHASAGAGSAPFAATPQLDTELDTEPAASPRGAGEI